LAKFVPSRTPEADSEIGLDLFSASGKLRDREPHAARLFSFEVAEELGDTLVHSVCARTEVAEPA
jgi:hypothetical protein